MNVTEGELIFAAYLTGLFFVLALAAWFADWLERHS